jgi:hypothetical protein
MQHRLTSLIGCASFCLVFSGSLNAHHSSAPHFDRDTEIVVEGTVTELKFVNPHAYLYFDVEKDGELVNWRCELSAATQLRRFGWSADMFTAGQRITVNGAPARREDNVCFLNSLTLDDGTVITRRGNLTEATQAARNAESSPSTDRAVYLDNGQPNLQGPWISRSVRRNSERIRPSFTATEAGKKAAEGYEMEFDDPILRCHVVNIFDGWNHDQHVNKIIQTDDTVTLQYGFMDFVRTIHLDLDEHPDDIEPSTGGHSIGHWDGDTLVVDTVGFEEGVLSHQSGLKHSDRMHVVERFHFDPERQYLVRDYTVTDSLYLVGESNGQDLMALSDTPYTPYNCVELSGDNNIRPSER